MPTSNERKMLSSNEALKELSIYYRIITHLISAETSKTGHVFAIRGE